MKRNIRSLTQCKWVCDGVNLFTDNRARTHIATIVLSPAVGKQAKRIRALIELAPEMANELRIIAEIADIGTRSKSVRRLLDAIGNNGNGSNAS